MGSYGFHFACFFSSCFALFFLHFSFFFLFFFLPSLVLCIEAVFVALGVATFGEIVFPYAKDNFNSVS